MRLLILLLMTALAAHGAWSGYFLQTPASSQVVSGPHTNFPVLIDLTDNHLKQIGGGGVVNDAQGDDVAPYSDATCTTLLPFELVAYDGTGGRWRAWVNVSSLSSSSNVYVCAGNSSQTVSLQNVSGTWNSAYVAVYHLGDGSTCGTGDSTSNALTLTNTGTVSGTTGKVYGACGTDFSTTKYLERAYSSPLNITSAITVSSWSRAGDFSAYRTIVGKSNSAASTRSFQLDTEITTGKLRGIVTVGGSLKVAVSSSAVSTSTLQHLAFAADATNVQTYINGAADGSSVSTGGALETTNNKMCIGAFCLSGVYDPWTHTIDEVFISNVRRSDGWIATEYNTGTPSTFWAAASWTSLSTATPQRRIFIQ